MSPEHVVYLPSIYLLGHTGVEHMEYSTSPVPSGVEHVSAVSSPMRASTRGMTVVAPGQSLLAAFAYAIPPCERLALFPI